MRRGWGDAFASQGTAKIAREAAEAGEEPGTKSPRPPEGVHPVNT